MTLEKLSEALGLGSNADAVLRTVREVYDVVDQRVAAQAAGHSFPCKSGCDACCYQSVFLSAPEWLLVAEELLLRRSAAERVAIVDEMCAIAERFEDELELIETISEGPERDEVALRIRFRCPLLSNAGRCSIYGVRELNGRTFGMTWNHKRQIAYGCELTHEYLRVLPDDAGPALFDAVDARRLLADAFPSVTFVHVYPWWFARYGDYLR